MLSQLATLMKLSVASLSVSCVALLLSACSSQPPTGGVARVTYPNGQITYAIDRHEDPHSRTQSIRIYREMRSVSPNGPENSDKAAILDIFQNGAAQQRFVELPIWSPDGRGLMFIEKERIKTVDANGENKADIGECGEITPNEWDFVWSPDSQRVAHACYGSIAVTNKDGSRYVLAADAELRDWENTPIGWSSDGQYLLFTQYSSSGTPADFEDGRDNRKLTFYKIPIPKTLPDQFQQLPKRSRTKLAEWPIEEVRSYAIHHNGQQIAVTLADAVELVSMDKGKQQPFLPGKFSGLTMWSDIQWSPDGRHIAFITGEFGDKTLWTMPSDGTGDRKKVRQAPAFKAWKWSPDSKELLFSTIATEVEGFNMSQGLFSFQVETQTTRTIVEPGEKGIEITSASWQPRPKADE